MIGVLRDMELDGIKVDGVELTRIGAILDLDFTTGYGTNVWDRSSNSLNATNYGGVSWTMPVNAINTTPAAVFPGALPGTIFRYDGQYIAASDLEPGRAYWAKFPGGTTGQQDRREVKP